MKQQVKEVRSVVDGVRVYQRVINLPNAAGIQHVTRQVHSLT